MNIFKFSAAFDVDSRKTRIAGGQFSRFMQFSFGFEDDSETILEKLYLMDFMGVEVRDTARALNDLFIIFKLYARSSVPKVLVILTYDEADNSEQLKYGLEFIC